MEATSNNMKDAAGTEPFICTIGHSTHPLEEFINLLKKNEVTHLLDVRTVPRSRHNPQFNKETLPDALRAMGIKYTHLPGLGGLRHARKDSINEGWRNASFRGYADYMQTQEFVENVNRVIELAAHDRCALMCAEAVPWRCHRSLIADALVVRGVRVEDIIDNHGRKPHSLTPWAQTDGLKIFYPAQQGRLI
ncbi:Protein of unknown function, DUF488 [Nitrosospira multiformis]|uniref:DNA repair protein n=1 Tax=Nitrosospira multiformis TaxID=1231 RepID=A0A1H9Z7Z0_9PROT|nr:DUF488 domain-containing protein [Nitrosospira multiformis]SES77195.1 Protein of unknown function, DUF488 [Nitrosospira multiformis]